jgi:sugar phosphate isomerase/epimerase
MKLGMVTYNMGKGMDLPALIKFCEETDLEGVELRTTHAHGVEIDLNEEQRREVKRRFEDSPIALAGLGSTYEYHSTDPAVVKQNIEGSIAYAQLAADVGAPGIKVRPNGIPDGVAPEQTCEQIGRALRQVAMYAEGIGVEVRLEVHGKRSSNPSYCRMMVDAADHQNVKICWNSNPTDMDEQGSIDHSFELLKDYIGLVHITDIGIPQYPWQDLFSKLQVLGYTGFCLAEIQYNEQPERFMKYYRTLFDLYTGNYKWRGRS